MFVVAPHEARASARSLWEQRRGSLVATVGTAALALAAFGFGAALAAVSALAGDASPFVFLALAAVPLLAVAVIVEPLVGVFVVLATMPIGSVGMAVGFISVQAVEGAVLVVALLVITRRLALGQTPLPWAVPLGFGLAVLGWVAVALYSALDEKLGVKQLLSLSGGLVLAAVVLAAARDMVDLRRILAGFVIVATAAAAVAVSGGAQFDSGYGGTQVSGRLTGAFEHPNQLGAASAMGIAVAAGLVFGCRTRRARLAAGATLPILMAALLLSLSRGAWIGVALAIALLLFTLREARELLLFLSIPLIIVAFVGGRLATDEPQFKVVGQRAKAITALSPYDEREQIWDEAIREIREDPLTGQGPGNFPVASLRSGSQASLVYADHAHNLALNWAAESGMPAVALIFAFAASLVVATRRASRQFIADRRRRDRAVMLGCAAALLTVVGQGIVDYTLGNPVIHIAFWTLVGALLVAARAGVGRAPVSAV